MPTYFSRRKEIRLRLDKCSLPLSYVKTVLLYRKKQRVSSLVWELNIKRNLQSSMAWPWYWLILDLKKKVSRNKLYLFLMSPDVWSGITESRGSATWNAVTEACQDMVRCVVWLGPQKPNEYKTKIRNCSVGTANSAGCVRPTETCQLDPKLHMLIAQKCFFRSSDTLPKPKSWKLQKPLTSARCLLCNCRALWDTEYKRILLESLNQIVFFHLTSL